MPIRASTVACRPLIDPRLFPINADCETSIFCSISKLENFLNPQSKNYICNRLAFLNKDLQFLEGLEEFFLGKSRITSDCRVCSRLKTLSDCSMLSEIVRNSFTGRDDLSELCRQICRFAIFNLCQGLYLLGGANDLFRENQDES